MPTTRLSALLIFASLLTACATTSHVMTGKAREPIDPSEVKIYSTAPPEYEEIAVIDASSRLSGSFGDQKKLDAVIERYYSGEKSVVILEIESDKLMSRMIKEPSTNNEIYPHIYGPINRNAIVGTEEREL